MSDFDWQIARGDTDYLEIEVVNEDTDSPVDITGAVIYFTVKKSSSESDAEALIFQEITAHTDSINGKSRLDILSSDTDLPIGRYLYDLVIVFPAGDRKHLISPSPFIITSTVKEV
ncbi:MAG: hypothetical protein WCG23_11320 [bacterium]